MVKPGLTTATDVVIDKVRYDGAPPWTTNASGTGSSLQLIDAKQDNSRPGNWFSLFRTAVYQGEIITPAHTNDGWRFVNITTNIGLGDSGGHMQLVMYLGEIGSAIIDDLSIVSGTVAADRKSVV